MLVEVPPGHVVYVDGDALPAPDGPVPALSVSPGRLLAWCGGPSVRMPDPLDPDTVAALAFLDVAQEAAASVPGLPPGSVEVTGAGLVAHCVRALVGVSARGSGRPRAIVDVTGDPAVIVDAIKRVDDLGTVVLAGESLERRAEMNLYPDVHLRGLTLVGVAPPLQGGSGVARVAETEVENRLVKWSRRSLVRIERDSPLPCGSTWFRVSS